MCNHAHSEAGFIESFSPKMVIHIEERVGQHAYALVTRTTRTSEQGCDCLNLSAASQASSHTMRQSQNFSIIQENDIKS